MDKHQRQNHYEKQWLGTILKDETLWQEKTINESVFYSAHTYMFYKLLEKLIGDKRNLDDNTWSTLTVDVLENIGGKAFIYECRSYGRTTTLTELKRLEKELQTYHIMQTMFDSVEAVKGKDDITLEDARAIAAVIQESIDGVKVKRRTFAQLLQDTHEKLMNVSEGMSGIDTGYDELNDMFDGWQTKDLIIIGARPSMGKTAITVNFFIKSALAGFATTYVPAETGDESIVKRCIAVLGGLPSDSIRNLKKYLSPKQLLKYQETMLELKKHPLHIEELHNINDIRQLIRERKRAEPKKRHLVIIDHLGHLSDDNNHANRTLEFESYCKQLKDIAKEMDVALILLSQLSRGVEQRQDKRPMLSDLRDSGSLEQIADVICFLYRENYYLPPEEQHQKDIIEFIIAKNRDGALGTIKFEFVKETTRVQRA